MEINFSVDVRILTFLTAEVLIRKVSKANQEQKKKSFYLILLFNAPEHFISDVK